jgi:membrane-associated phospholipid phosphatase
MSKKKQNKNIRVPLIHPTIHLLLALVLFVLAVWLSRGADMQTWEISLFMGIYGWPEMLIPLFLVISWFGTIYALAILSVILFIKKRFNELLRLILTAVLAYELSGFAKDLWGRTRPNEILADVVNRDYYRGPGFPSGHMALAVAMAFVIGHYLPKKYHWVVAVWIIGVGLSRIYLGVHAPLDIVGGFAIGWFSYMLFRHVRLYPVRFGKRAKKSTK